jgi:hypothetical protein
MRAPERKILHISGLKNFIAIAPQTPWPGFDRPLGLRLSTPFQSHPDDRRIAARATPDLERSE